MQTATIVPSFANRRSIDVQDLPRVNDLCVVFEFDGIDEEGKRYYVYTVGGYLDGRPLGNQLGGVNVGQQQIFIHNATSREHADWLASDGVETTANAQARADRDHEQRLEAQARLASIGALERMRLAQAPASDKSDQFVQDADAIRPLAGDDIILTTGGTPH